MVRVAVGVAVRVTVPAGVLEGPVATGLFVLDMLAEVKAGNVAQDRPRVTVTVAVLLSSAVETWNPYVSPPVITTVLKPPEGTAEAGRPRVLMTKVAGRTDEGAHMHQYENNTRPTNAPFRKTSRSLPPALHSTVKDATIVTTASPLRGASASRQRNPKSPPSE